jgi:hypothetical protein
MPCRFNFEVHRIIARFYERVTAWVAKTTMDFVFQKTPWPQAFLGGGYEAIDRMHVDNITHP